MHTRMSETELQNSQKHHFKKVRNSENHMQFPDFLIF